MRPLGKDDPRQIGPFRIIGLLGGGGMGRVYLGRATDGRTVAVKTARAELADDRGFRTRFAREVAAARRVGGPFVAPVVDAAPHDDVPWMATDYVPGISLTDAVHDHGPLPEHAVLLLTAGLLHALTAVHAQGLVHRDLKPSNVLLTADGPRVIDFGIAYSAAHTALTTTGTALGTPGFMAPEQLVMSGPDVTAATDVFALGGVIVFATTGVGPYGSAEPHALMYRTVHEEPRLDGLPGRLRELAASCLAKGPGLRPTPAALLARADTPDQYGDWLPRPVALELRRLSDRLADPRSAHALTARPTPAGSPAVPDALLPAGTTAVTPPPGPPSAAAPSPGAPAHTPPGAPPTPSKSAARGPSRRRVLTALAAVGTVAGGGTLARALLPDDTGDDNGGGTADTSSTSRSPSPGALYARLPRGIREKGAIVVGSDLAYAPMEFLRDGEPTGADINLAQALGGVLGVRVVIRNAAFDTLLAGLAASRFDLVVSAMTDNEDRREGRVHGTKTGSGVDFVDYLNAGLALVVRKGNPEGIDKPGDLSGTTVAVQRGSTAHAYLDDLGREFPDPPTPREFDSQEEIYADVSDGRSSAGLDDLPVAAHTVATRTGGTPLELTGAQLDPLPYGIAVAKTAPGLRDAVRQALDRLIADGTYTKILRKWHIEDGAVTRAVVNAGR